MCKCDVKYLLGIDGGGTKTEFLLTEISGQEKRRIVLGGTNPVNIGIENACAVLADGINKICDGLEYSQISVFAGFAGAKTNRYEDNIRSFLSGFGFFAYDCGSDIDLALELTLSGENGTAVILGTGIVAFSRNGERLYRTGGRGYMIDKGGSGFHFGSEALNSAFCFLDGRDGSELIFKLVQKRIGKPLEESLGEIYKSGPSYVASFAPVVFDAYALGDIKAVEIIKRNAKEIVCVINGALKYSGCLEKNVVICGGLSKQEAILLPLFKEYLSDDVNISFNGDKLVKAAVTLAKRISGE